MAISKHGRATKSKAYVQTRGGSHTTGVNVRGFSWALIRQNPSVSKSNRIHVVIIRFYITNLTENSSSKMIHKFSWSMRISTGYYSNSTTLNMLISVRWRLVLEPIVTQNTKCHLKVQLVLATFYEALIFYLQFFIWRSTKMSSNTKCAFLNIQSY